MADNKPTITATIKFRGVTIEDMSLQELRELRDVLNTIVGEPPRAVERIVERHEHVYPYRVYPYATPIWAVSQTFTGVNTSGSTSTNHFTLNCN